MTDEEARRFARTDHCEDILRLAEGRPIRTIVDVGANVGETVNRYVQTFSEALVYACEPVWQTFLTLARNSGSHRRVHCLNTALGSAPGTATLHHQRFSGQNSLHAPINKPDPACPTSEEVTITTLDQIAVDLQLRHIDLLKVDTEHFEVEVLRGARRCLRENRISFIYCEVTFLSAARQNTPFSELESFLVPAGFRLVGFYEHFYHPQSGVCEFCNALFVHESVGAWSLPALNG